MTGRQLLVEHVAYGKYQRVSHGWISQHKVATTWDKAYKQCQLEGAVLASPVTKELLDIMQSLINTQNIMYFTGTSATYNKEIYASIEGVLLDDMPVTDLFEQLNPKQGQCLAMNSHTVSAVPCSSELPYMCYKKQTVNSSLTQCGTYDTGYKFVKRTGTCYKFHHNEMHWSDAYTTCIAEGGYLAIISDSAEAQLLVNDIIDKRGYYVWIGLVDWAGTNDWKSIHGHPLNELYHEWEIEPKSNGTADCATINPLLGKNSAKFKPFKCNSTPTTFLCERDPAYIQYKEYIYEA